MEPVCDWIDLQLKRSGVEATSEDILLSSTDAVGPPPVDIVLVHCKYGISRSATMLIAYLMRRYHWQRDKALEYVKAKRGSVRPNRGFLEQLKLWSAMGYQIWETYEGQGGEMKGKVAKSGYAMYLERRAAALKAKGLAWVCRLGGRSVCRPPRYNTQERRRVGTSRRKLGQCP